MLSINISSTCPTI